MTEGMGSRWFSNARPCRIRKLLGDDPKRIEHDIILIGLGHEELANRLFECKEVKGKFVREKAFDILKLCRGDNK